MLDFQSDMNSKTMICNLMLLPPLLLTWAGEAREVAADPVTDAVEDMNADAADVAAAEVRDATTAKSLSTN